MESVESEFIFVYGDFEALNETTAIALQLFNELSTPSELYNNQRAYEAYIYVAKAVAYGSDHINYSELNKYNFPKFLGDLLMHLYEINDELDFEKIFKKDETNKLWNAHMATDQNEKRIYVLSCSLYIINLTAMNNLKFNLEFSLNMGLNAHLLFISNEKFTEKNLNSKINMWSKYNEVIEYLVMNLNSLTKMCDENKKKWTDLNAVDILLRIKKLKPTTELDACCGIANIANDKQIESLKEIHSVVDKVLSQINQAALDFKSNKFDRKPRQVFENNSSKNCQVHCIEQENKTFTSVLVLLQCLYKISVNDSIKTEIYLKKNLKDSLKVLLKLGNETEIKYSLRLLAQFTFNKEISTDIMNDQEMKDTLNEISLNYPSRNEGENDFSIINIYKQINWNMYKVNNEIKTHSEETQETDEHVMISYNTGSRETCLKIKNKLESFGHKVWIDINDIHGSSLDSMAKAIEKSYCVLICVTEKYRQSINCQAEAQYAFRIKKPIIPLILQSGYESVKGWLGIIIGDKIFINFMKYDFEESIKRLRKEVDSFLTVKLKTQVQELKPNETKNKTDEILKWDEHKVKEWFKENNLNKAIMKSMSPCTGIVLTQLNEMKKEAPEFFYQSLKNDSISINSLLIFTFHLKNLFS